MSGRANPALSALAFLVTLFSINCDDISWSGNVNPAYDELYADALRAYYKDDWAAAVTKFEEAIDDWKKERQFTIVCRKECQAAFETSKAGKMNLFGIDYLSFMNYMRNCSNVCMKKNMGYRLKVSKHTHNLFEDRVPYSFLQFAYHKNGNNSMAIRAASTFLRFSPKDETMNSNMKYYTGLPEFKDLNADDIESLAPIQHHELYEKGRKAYNAEKWQDSVDFFEAALNEYTKAYKECQILCGKEMEDKQQYVRGGVYGFFMELLLCRLDCPRQLSLLLNFPQPGYLSKHYDFLHFAYNRLTRFNDSLPCAVTNLLLNPSSEHMKNNIKFYKKNDYPVDNVKPREDGRYLFEDIRTQMELYVNVKSYLIDLDEEYQGSLDLEDTTYEAYLANGMYPDEPTPEYVKESEEDEFRDYEDEPYKRFPPPSKEHIERFLQSEKRFQDISLTMMEQQLNGSYRAVFDGVATEDECKKLMDLGLTMGNPGDGYGDRRSPHTVKEEFLGVNLDNATWAAAKGDTTLEKAELYANLSEKVRQVTEAYFRLSTPLYFSFTHLVCRKAIADSSRKGLHISHPVHSDNCILRNGKNVTCVKEHPAYVWRDYSAILYLNEKFTGGQFFFAMPNLTVEAIVKPKCGRMVAFSAGFENLHGVLGITEGTRCALPIWFTLDKKYVEKQRQDADEVLRDLRQNKFAEKVTAEGHKEL